MASSGPASGAASGAATGVVSSEPGDPGNQRVAQLRSQVNDVKDVMSKNIERVMERGDNLDDLVNKTTDLEAGAAVFRDRSSKVKRKMWWKNTKMTLILVVVGLVIIVAIILASINWSSSNADASPSSATSPAPNPT